MSVGFGEWVRLIIDVKILTKKCRDPLLINLVNNLARIGEAFKNEPEYGLVMNMLEDARRELAQGGTVANASDGNANNTHTSDSALPLEAVVSNGMVELPGSVVKALGLVHGEAVVKLRARGRTVEFRTRLLNLGGDGGSNDGSLWFYIPHYVMRRYGIVDGDRVVVVGITQEWVGEFPIRRRMRIYIPADTARRVGIRPGPAIVKMRVGMITTEFRATLRKHARYSAALEFEIPTSVARLHQIGPGDVVAILSIRNLDDTPN
mgnify:CR=1 FL=1